MSKTFLLFNEIVEYINRIPYVTPSVLTDQDANKFLDTVVEYHLISRWDITKYCYDFFCPLADDARFYPDTSTG